MGILEKILDRLPEILSLDIVRIFLWLFFIPTVLQLVSALLVRLILMIKLGRVLGIQSAYYKILSSPVAVIEALLKRSREKLVNDTKTDIIRCTGMDGELDFNDMYMTYTTSILGEEVLTYEEKNNAIKKIMAKIAFRQKISQYTAFLADSVFVFIICFLVSLVPAFSTVMKDANAGEVNVGAAVKLCFDTFRNVFADPSSSMMLIVLAFVLAMFILAPLSYHSHFTYINFPAKYFWDKVWKEVKRGSVSIVLLFWALESVFELIGNSAAFESVINYSVRLGMFASFALILGIFALLCWVVCVLIGSVIRFLFTGPAKRRS